MDAVLIAARVAPRTRHIGLLPSAVATHTEPFHLSKAIATLDYVSSGRAGIQVEVTASAAAARHFGRRPAPESAQARYDEATDYVEVLRRLWDSWEDDAEIRDSATGRFIDRKKLHYIDFDGKWFSVKGPSITPRPPQGQPLVAALDDGEDSRRFIARSADIGFITPSNRAGGRRDRRRGPCAAGRCTAGADFRRSAGLPRRHCRTCRRPPSSTRRPGGCRVHRRRSRVRRDSGTACRPCCRIGMPQGWPASGCGPPRFRMTCCRSPADSHPSCTVAGCFVAATAPQSGTTCARRWAFPDPPTATHRPDNDFRGHHP